MLIQKLDGLVNYSSAEELERINSIAPDGICRPCSPRTVGSRVGQGLGKYGSRINSTLAVTLLCVGLTVAACGGATHKSPTSIPKPRTLHEPATPGSTGLSTAPSVNAAGFPKVPASGIYADGAQGTPHYFVSLSSTPDGHISGSMNFLYQDGQTVSVFTFAGSGQDGVASLSPVASGQFGPGNVIPASLPRTLSMTWGAGGISFGECTGYLPAVTSMSGCAFEPAYQGMSTSASAP